MLDLRGGGWVLLLAVILCAAVFAWRMGEIVAGRRHAALGDGKNPATYGFDLANATVPRDEIVASGMTKDGLHALVNPALLSPAGIDSLARARRVRLLVPSDRVIGVTIGRSARAYPVRFLNWHEVANDTLGRTPICVTYNPLCDAAIVFRRDLGSDTLRFGVSGLLYDSNLLMYDVRPRPRDESLWSQILMRAVAGPAAGRALAAIPAALVHWEDWRGAHPTTTVIAPVPSMMDAYKSDPYNVYFASERLRFPVRAVPGADLLPPKTPVVVVGVSGVRRVFPLPAIAARADPAGFWSADLPGAGLRIRYRDDPPAAALDVDAPGCPVEVCYSFWFAWHAMHPDDALFTR